MLVSLAAFVAQFSSTLGLGLPFPCSFRHDKEVLWTWKRNPHRSPEDAGTGRIGGKRKQKKKEKQKRKHPQSRQR
ncbi:Trna (Adenine(58)-N(1))-Methyltransferase Non-Catalytic Subunit Trm6 [Manis pentadactyla]|nr:Trna (Adenine(58)-N(1))-Methyltransferase Non-Catalytic Subunit Trm6 [Manis pentadactyla]